jgi:DNA-binding beta-propeller fold protein YncE
VALNYGPEGKAVTRTGKNVRLCQLSISQLKRRSWLCVNRINDMYIASIKYKYLQLSLRHLTSQRIHIYFSKKEDFCTSMDTLKKVVRDTLTASLLIILICQIGIYCNEVSALQIALKYKGQLGSKGSANGQFMFPHSLAVDNSGNIYVGDTGNKRIQKFSPSGTFLTSWGSAGSNKSQFQGLHDVTLDPEGKYVYTVELKNHRVQKFYPNGTFISKWGFNGTGGRDSLRAPHQIAVDSNGLVYLTDRDSNQLLKFYSNGTFVESIGSKGTGPGQFYGPHGIAIDSHNNIYITDMHNSRVQIFDSKGTFVREWGSFGNGTGQFSETAPGIAVDMSDHVFVVDKINGRVQLFDTKGNYLAAWGSPGKSIEQLNKPEDIAVDNHGGIYITDTRNSRIQLLNLAS